MEDNLFPHPVDDEFLNEIPGAEPNAQPGASPSVLHYFIEIVKLYQILKEVHLACRVRLQDADAVYCQIQVSIRLHKLVMDWRERLPEEMKYEWTHLDPSDKTPRPTSPAQLASFQEPLALQDLARRLYCRSVLHKFHVLFF